MDLRNPNSIQFLIFSDEWFNEIFSNYMKYIMDILERVLYV